MKINTSVSKAKAITVHHALKLSEKTIAKKTVTDNSLTDLADVVFFIFRFIKETFSGKFEGREFLHQCFTIGNGCSLNLRCN